MNGSSACSFLLTIVYIRPAQCPRYSSVQNNQANFQYSQKPQPRLPSTHSYHVQAPPFSPYPYLGDLEKDVFLLPILQPCHPRLSQGVSSLLLKAYRLLPLLPRCHQPSHDPISHVLRINKNIQLTKLITAPPKTLSPPTLPLRTHLPLPLSPNSRPSLPPASRLTPPTERLVIHTITSPWHRAWTSTLQT